MFKQIAKVGVYSSPFIYIGYNIYQTYKSHIKIIKFYDFENIGIETNILFDKMKEYNTFIAGSYPYNLLIGGKNNNDIDFFIDNRNNYINFINWFELNGFEKIENNNFDYDYKSCLVMERTKMKKDNIIIDLVFIDYDIHNDPIKYLEYNTDFNCCMFAIDYTGELLTTNENKKNINELKNNIITVKNKFYNFDNRLQKYLNKNYTIKFINIEENEKDKYIFNNCHSKYHKIELPYYGLMSSLTIRKLN